MTADAPVLVTADIHAQKSPWAHRSVWGDSEFAFRQLRDYARQYRVGWVLVLGDLKDRVRTTPLEDGMWLQFLDELAEDGIRLAYVQGNHDKSDPPCLWRYPRALHLHGRLLEAAGERIWGIDFQPPGSLRESLEQVPPEATVLAMHQPLRPWNPSPSADDLDDLPWPPSVRLVLVGDHHEPEQITKAARTYVSPGSVVRQSLAEQTDKSAVLLEPSGRLTRLPLRTRPVIRSPLLADPRTAEDWTAALPSRVAEATAAAVAAGVPPVVAVPLVVITYTAAVRPAVRAASALTEPAHLFWVERVAADDGRVVRSAAGGPVGLRPVDLVPVFVDPAADPWVADVVTALLRAPDRERARAALEELSERFHSHVSCT